MVEEETLSGNVLNHRTVDHRDAEFGWQIVENPDVVVANKPIYFHAEVGKLRDFSEKPRESSRHHIAVFIPIVEDVAEEVYFFSRVFNRVEKRHHAPLVVERRVKLARSKMEIGEEICQPAFFHHRKPSSSFASSVIMS